MNNEIKDSCHEVPSCAQSDAHFIWPLGKGTTPDEMNTSFGPRIDADRWDFHDGIDLPAAVGTPVHAMADGVVHRAGPADKTGPGGFRLNACPSYKSAIRRTDRMTCSSSISISTASRRV